VLEDFVTAMKEVTGRLDYTGEVKSNIDAASILRAESLATGASAETLASPYSSPWPSYSADRWNSPNSATTPNSNPWSQRCCSTPSLPLQTQPLIGRLSLDVSCAQTTGGDALS
jgi:hypothetical protein